MLYLSPYKRMRNPIGFFSNFMNAFDQDLFEQEALFQDSALVNVYEGEKTINVLLESPGLKKENINIHCDGKSLLIEWEKKMDLIEKDASLEEINTEEKVRRQLTLPAYVNEETIHAHYSNGILYITLEKKDKPETKKIDVK